LDKFVAAGQGYAEQLDATSQRRSQDKLISTDPPYYDNIGYADLSEFFYVWLRRSLRGIEPDLTATIGVPKAEELVATPYRQGSREDAESFFLNGMTRAVHRLAEQTHAAFPVTIYYAFKQSESDTDGGASNTGWETFLDAVIRAGFSLSGTWPVRTEQLAGLKGSINALASSIVLVCRPRSSSAPNTSRREFVAALKAELPPAIADLQRGNIAPVDLEQAALGPGMAIFTRYAAVLDAEGHAMSVAQALGLINQTLDETLSEQGGDFDADTRWALRWFEEVGFGEGEYGRAEQLSKSKVTSVQGMVDAGILAAARGKVRLLQPDELNPDWDPAADTRRPAWQAVHQLILTTAKGEEALADLIAKLGAEAEIARELAYRLYLMCHRTKRATEAGWYNGLVQSWPEAVRLASDRHAERPVQAQLFGEG
jgi:putative DNA methylase